MEERTLTGQYNQKSHFKKHYEKQSIHRSADNASPHTGAVEIVQAYRVGNGKALQYGSLNSINRLQKMRRGIFTPHLTVFSGSIAWNSNLQYRVQIPELVSLLSFYTTEITLNLNNFLKATICKLLDNADYLFKSYHCKAPDYQ